MGQFQGLEGETGTRDWQIQTPGRDYEGEGKKGRGRKGRGRNGGE